MQECDMFTYNYSETSISQIQVTNCLLFIYMDLSNVLYTSHFQVQPHLPTYPLERIEEKLH